MKIRVRNEIREIVVEHKDADMKQQIVYSGITELMENGQCLIITDRRYIAEEDLLLIDGYNKFESQRKGEVIS